MIKVAIDYNDDTYEVDTYRCVELIVSEDTVRVWGRYHSDNGTYMDVYNDLCVSVDLPAGLENYSQYAEMAIPVADYIARKSYVSYQGNTPTRIWTMPNGREEVYRMLENIKEYAYTEQMFFGS